MDPQTKILNRHAKGLIGSLVVQYALGMAVNMFVLFPESATAGELWKFGWSQTLFAAHVIIGTLLVIGAVFFFIRSIRFHDSAWKMWSGAGLIAILLAWLCGGKFMDTQNDAYSYAMSIAFLAALFSYWYGLYKHKEVI